MAPFACSGPCFVSIASIASIERTSRRANRYPQNGARGHSSGSRSTGSSSAHLSMHVHVHAVIVKNKDEQLESLKSIADTIAMMGRMPKVWFGKLERKKSRQTEETGHAQHHQPIISRRLSHYTNRDRRKRGAKEEIPHPIDRGSHHV